MTDPGWTNSNLDDVTLRGSGHTPNQQHPEYWDGEIKWVSLADSRRLDKGYISSSTRRITARGVEKSSAVLHPAGTVIMSRDAGVGKSAILGDAMAVSQHFIAWNCEAKGMLEPWYLYFWLQSRKGYFERMAVGSTIKTIGLPLFRKLTISHPPLPEQRRIAEILRTWDGAIELVESRHLQALQRRNGLVQKLIFGHGWPHGVIWHQTSPAWDIRPIGKVASDVSSRNANLTATDVLTCSKHRGFVRSADYFARTVHSADLSNYKVIRRGQFGFPSNHIEEGSIGLQNIVDIGAVSPIYTVFEFDRTLIDADFAYLVLKTRAYAHMFDVSTSSSVDRRGSLRWPEFSKLPFPVPPLDEQRRIAAIASDADREIELIWRKAELLRTQKRGLMQKLLTGQVRVNVAAEIEPGGESNE